MSRINSLAGTHPFAGGCYRWGCLDTGLQKVSVLRVSTAQVSVCRIQWKWKWQEYFSLLNLGWQEKIFVKLVSWASDSWLLGMNTHGFCFSLFLSGFSPFTLFYVLRAWPHDKWEYISWHPPTRGCTCRGTPCSLSGQRSSQGVFCVHPVPPRDDLLSPPAARCKCIWQATEEAVDLSLGNLNPCSIQGGKHVIPCVLEQLFKDKVTCFPG